MLFRPVDINDSMTVEPISTDRGHIAQIWTSDTEAGWISLTRDEATKLIEALEEALS